MPEWKTIKAPKGLYLPVVIAGKGFSDSGMRVEPDDKLEILPDSNQIRINGVEHRLMIAVDTLRLDDKGVIQLSKPAPPSRINSGGHGYAAVGGMGKAVLQATSFVATAKAPRRSAGGATRARGFPIVSDETGPFGTPTRPAEPEVAFFDDGMDLGEPDSNFDPGDIDAAFADPNLEKRTIQLADGSEAWAWFDKRSGQQVGTPTRMYQAHFDAEGQQMGQRVRTTGPKVKFDEDEYQKALAEQMADSTLAPTGHDQAPPRAQPKHAPRTLHGRAPTPVQVANTPPCASTGSPHLDNLIAAATWGGFPIGKLTWLQGPAATRTALLSAAQATYTKSFASALGDMALLKEGTPPIIVLELEDLLSTEARLGLADDLPTLVEQVAGIKKAAFVISTPTPEKDMKLLKYMSQLVVIVAAHTSDERFHTAALIKNEVMPKQQGLTITFPAPG